MSSSTFTVPAAMTSKRPERSSRPSFRIRLTAEWQLLSSRGNDALTRSTEPVLTASIRSCPTVPARPASPISSAGNPATIAPGPSRIRPRRTGSTRIRKTAAVTTSNTTAVTWDPAPNPVFELTAGRTLFSHLRSAPVIRCERVTACHPVVQDVEGIVDRTSRSRYRSPITRRLFRPIVSRSESLLFRNCPV